MWDFAFCGGETVGFDKFGEILEVCGQGFGTVFLYILTVVWDCDIILLTWR